MYNLNYAFEVAEKELDIPKMLDAEGKIFLTKDFFNTSVDFWAAVSFLMV